MGLYLSLCLSLNPSEFGSFQAGALGQGLSTQPASGGRVWTFKQGLHGCDKRSCDMGGNPEQFEECSNSRFGAGKAGISLGPTPDLLQVFQCPLPEADGDSLVTGWEEGNRKIGVS